MSIANGISHVEDVKRTFAAVKMHKKLKKECKNITN